MSPLNAVLYGENDAHDHQRNVPLKANIIKELYIGIHVNSGMHTYYATSARVLDGAMRVRMFMIVVLLMAMILLVAMIMIVVVTMRMTTITLFMAMRMRLQENNGKINTALIQQL